MGNKKSKKSGKARRTEALDNIEYGTLRSAGELSDIQHVLDAMLEVLKEIHDSMGAMGTRSAGG